jgi:hypothetical protein
LETSEKFQPGLTPKSLAVILILIVLMGITQTFFYFATGIADFAMYWNDDHRPGLLFKGIGWWFLMLILITAITGKVGLTKQESVVVLASAFLAGSEIGPMIAGVIMSVPFGANDPALSKYLVYMPSWYRVPPEASDAWLRGGAVRWDLIGGTFMGWVLVIIIWQLFQFSTALIMRHTVIDVEKLPFPWAQPAAILLENCTKMGDEKPTLFSIKEPILKRIWIGFVLGIVLYLIFIPRFWIPEFPAPIMPEYHCTSPVHPWLFDFRGAWVHTLPWVSCYLSIQPELVASTFFFPMDVLLTVTILYFLFIIILPPIVAPLGWQGREYGGQPWWISIPNAGSWCAYWQDMSQLPFNLLFAFFAGIVFYGLWRFIWGWRSFKDTLMGLFGRKVPGEENDPLPIRYLWILVIALFLISMGMLVVGFEMTIGVAFITIFWSLVYWYSSVRLAGEAGPTNFWSGGSEFADVVPYMGYRFGLMQERTTGAAMSMLFANNYTFGYISPASFSAFGLAGYSIARGTGTRPRDIFIAQVLTIVISLPLVYFFAVTSITSLGWTVKFKGKPSWTGSWMSWFGGAAENSAGYIKEFEDPATGLWQPWLVGAILFFVLMVARSLFVWWPLNPVAFLIFGLYNTIKFSPAIAMTFFIKLAVTRIGGTPLYDKATHLCAGLIAGSLVGRVILQVIGYVTGLPLVY